MKLSVILEKFPNGWEVNKNPYQRSRISCEIRFSIRTIIKNHRRRKKK